MKIEIGKFKIEAPAIAAVILAIIADSMYANHCRKKVYKNIIDKMDEAEAKGES